MPNSEASLPLSFLQYWC